jgi:hypothetical protein
MLDGRVALLAKTFLDADDMALPTQKPGHDIDALLASLPRSIAERRPAMA